MALGWEIYVTKEGAEKSFAIWTVGLGGIKWLDQLVELGLAEQLTGNGYPTSYKMQAKQLLPFFRLNQLPNYTGQLVIGEDYVREGGLHTGVIIRKELMSECSDDDPLLVEAWDQS